MDAVGTRSSHTAGTVAVHTFESQAWVKQQVVLVESTQVAVEKKTKKMLDRRIQNDSGVCGPQQRSNAAMKTYPMLEATLTVDLTAWAIIEMLWGRERWASGRARGAVRATAKKIKCGLRISRFDERAPLEHRTDEQTKHRN